MIRIFLLAILQLSHPLFANENIEGHLFITKEEYHKMDQPCACPSDRAKNGRCGKRAAICKNGGFNILDCTSKKIKSIADYKEVKKSVCGGVDF